MRYTPLSLNIIFLSQVPQADFIIIVIVCPRFPLASTNTGTLTILVFDYFY